MIEPATGETLPLDKQFQQEPLDADQTDDADETDEQPDIFPTVYRSAQDAADAEALAQAERAVARHGATPEQRDGVAEAAQARRAEDRLEGWRKRQ